MSRFDEAESAISGFLELTGDIASLATGGAISAMGKRCSCHSIEIFISRKSRSL